MSARRATSPWKYGAGNIPYGVKRPNRRVLKKNKRLYFVVKGAVANGLTACPWCSTIEVNHDMEKCNADELEAKRNSEEEKQAS